MKSFLRNILLVVVAGFSMQGVAQSAHQPLDTIYFYRNWAQLLNLEPTAYIVNPLIFEESPCEVYVETSNVETNRFIEDEYMALSLGDSIFLLNSNYLKRNFKGDVRGLKGFVPLFFNDKVAYVIFDGPLKVVDVLFGVPGDGATTSNYYIDFSKSRVQRVTHEYLSELLEDYHDLKMRYEGMKDYKKNHIIEEYFFKYIDRATDDFMHPFILDLVQ